MWVSPTLPYTSRASRSVASASRGWFWLQDRMPGASAQIHGYISQDAAGGRDVPFFTVCNRLASIRNSACGKLIICPSGCRCGMQFDVLFGQVFRKLLSFVKHIRDAQVSDHALPEQKSYLIVSPINVLFAVDLEGPGIIRIGRECPRYGASITG